jgi:hypothetical protein
MGSLVMFWPGSPPIVTDDSVSAMLPQDMIDGLGQPRRVSTPEEIFGLLRET